MRVDLDRQSVIKANAQFWEQMLSMTLEAMHASEEFCVGSGHLLGSVGLSGVWHGRVEVRLAGGLAYAATAAMMMQALDTVVDADALDATKEIANMIAGTIKSSLPRPCSMTVPQAVKQQEPFSGSSATEDSLTVAFRHPAGDLMVRVWELECIQG